MAEISLYPLRFEPIYQYRIWGGRRLAGWLDAPLPGAGPIGEAWLLSDRADFPSRVADGPLKGLTIAQLMRQSPERMMGRSLASVTRFPLLLKFLDVRMMLSVQVHPADRQTELIPKGESGKTEAWVVLESDPGSRLYAGLKPGVTEADLRGLTAAASDTCLAGFHPMPEQGVFIQAGTVHSIGDGVVVFEVQEDSDVTYRLFDWDHVDAKTGQKRALQIDDALACIDPTQPAIQPVVPAIETNNPVMRERLFDCRQFRLWRLQGAVPFTVGATDEPRVLVCLDGKGNIEFGQADFAIQRGAAMLLPASLGACRVRPDGNVTLLEIAVPHPPLMAASTSARVGRSAP